MIETKRAMLMTIGHAVFGVFGAIVLMGVIMEYGFP